MGDLVYIRYKDHVLFRDSDPCLYKPSIRETVGWLMKENEEAVWIIWDRSVHTLPYEKVQPWESGLVILKSHILEMRRLG